MSLRAVVHIRYVTAPQLCPLARIASLGVEGKWRCFCFVGLALGLRLVAFVCGWTVSGLWTKVNAVMIECVL